MNEYECILSVPGSNISLETTILLTSFHFHLLIGGKLLPCSGPTQKLFMSLRKKKKKTIQFKVSFISWNDAKYFGVLLSSVHFQENQTFFLSVLYLYVSQGQLTAVTNVP